MLSELAEAWLTACSTSMDMDGVSYAIVIEAWLTAMFDKCMEVDG